MAWICLGAKRGKSPARPIPVSQGDPPSPQLSPPSRRKTVPPPPAALRRLTLCRQSFSGLLATDRTALENVDLWNAAEKGDLAALQKQPHDALLLKNKHDDTLMHFVRGAARPIPPCDD